MGASIKDEAMRALEGSLATAVAHTTALEAQLAACQSELSAAHARAASAAAERDQSLADARAAQLALAERDEKIEELSSALQKSETHAEQADSRLIRLLGAGQQLVGKAGTAVLSAQEISAKARPLEENLLPIPTGPPRSPRATAPPLPVEAQPRRTRARARRCLVQCHGTAQGEL